MALNSKDRGKILHSVARWLAGLKPVFGSKHYFEKYSYSRCVIEKLGAYRGARECPFCHKKFRRIAALVTHLIKFHSEELEEILEKCREESS